MDLNRFGAELAMKANRLIAARVITPKFRSSHFFSANFTIKYEINPTLNPIVIE